MECSGYRCKTSFMANLEKALDSSLRELHRASLKCGVSPLIVLCDPEIFVENHHN